MPGNKEAKMKHLHLSGFGRSEKWKRLKCSAQYQLHLLPMSVSLVGFGICGYLTGG